MVTFIKLNFYSDFYLNINRLPKLFRKHRNLEFTNYITKNTKRKSTLFKTKKSKRTESTSRVKIKIF